MLEANSYVTKPRNTINIIKHAPVLKISPFLYLLNCHMYELLLSLAIN